MKLAVTNRYIRGIGLINSDDNGWYLFNGHGDVIQLADGTGTVTKTYAYDAFGNERNLDPNDTNPFRYSGEYYDAETGTIYLRARYYEPGIGRFLAEDSVRGNNSDPLSLNLYTYCYNNPVNRIDPSGHFAPLVAYLAETAVETAPDVVLDMLLEGEDFTWWKSVLGNYFPNLVPGWGESKKAYKIAKIAEKYGPEAVEFIVKHGDEAVSYINKYGLERFSTYVKGFREPITAPTNRGGLKYALSKISSPPADMVNTQVHHGLPWGYKDWFAKKGLNVNDPAFGAYVRGGGKGGHQSWSKAYENEWTTFISDNPDANAQQIIDFYNTLRKSSRWDGGF